MGLHSIAKKVAEDEIVLVDLSCYDAMNVGVDVAMTCRNFNQNLKSRAMKSIE